MYELHADPGSQAVIASHDPATGEVLGTVPRMDAEAVAAAVGAARAAFPAWHALGYAGRRRHLLRFRDRLVVRADELARLITRENGKPLAESLQEVYSACEFLAYYAGRAERLLRDEAIRVVNPLLANKKTFLTHRPKGVVGVISPWNYPVLLTMAEVSGALAVGNTVVLKPSEHTPLTGLSLASAAAEAGLPAGVFAVVTGEGPTGAALVEAGVDHVCFTGSTATGKRVAQSAMGRLAGVTLELGGKDPAVVLPDIDCDFVARGLVWAAFTNAGQACASVERAYVHRRVALALIPKIVEATRALRVGNGLDPATEVGPIITERQLQTIEAHVEDAVAKGARVLVGGHRLPGPGTFYAPTVLVDVTPEMAVMRDETFGPVLPIAVADDEEALVELANDSPYGLSASVWTRDVAHGEAIARRILAGSVWVNTGLASYGNPLTPRGGIKASGIGKIGGRTGLLELVHTQLVDIAAHGKAKDWWFPVGPGLYPMLSGGLQAMHGAGLRQRLKGLVGFVRHRR